MINKHQFAKNVSLKTMEHFFSKGISLLVSIVLARIVLPDAFGLIALTAVFTNLSDILIESGFSTALIRKESVDEFDYSAVLFVSFFIAFVLYIVLFFSAPIVSSYYSSPELKSVLRIIGLSFFFQSFNSVNNGIVNRNMQFKLLFKCSILASLASGIVGIALAILGFGVWALVGQRLMQQLVLTLSLFLCVGWRIKWSFDWKRIKQMSSFTIGVVSSSLINYLGGSIYSLGIGKIYSVTDLGFYDKGNQLPRQFSLYTFGAMSSVLLPTISSCQTDLDRVKTITRKVVRMTSFLVMPLMVGLSCVSKEVIILLFTDKWISSIRIMQYACLYYLATPYMLICIQVFFALGKSYLRVKSEIIQLGLLAFGLIIFGFILNCSMNELALICAIIAMITSFVMYSDLKTLIHYDIKEAICDIIKPLCSSIFMGFTVLLINSICSFSTILLALLMKTSVGIVSFIGSSFLLKTPELKELALFLRKGK